MVIRRISLVALLILAFISMATAVALATEGDEVTETTVAATDGEAEGEATVDVQPAVELNQDVPGEANLDWTYRYMIPTGIVLGAIVIVITAGQYFAQVVRKRYRIVEE